MVTGTERGVGKTLVTTAMVRSLRQIGVNAVAMKLVAKGSIRDDGAWHSDEMQRLAAVSAFGFPQSALCAHWHSEAGDATQSVLPMPALSIDTIVDTFQVLSTWADTVVVEDSPDMRHYADDRFDGSRVAAELMLPMVLVVGMKNGCVHSALEIATAFAGRGLECAGWVANQLDSAWTDSTDAVKAIAQGISAPCLGSIPHLQADTAATAMKGIDIKRMLSALARW
jgi:dethiobiotin synthetase